MCSARGYGRNIPTKHAKLQNETPKRGVYVSNMNTTLACCHPPLAGPWHRVQYRKATIMSKCSGGRWNPPLALLLLVSFAPASLSFLLPSIAARSSQQLQPHGHASSSAWMATTTTHARTAALQQQRQRQRQYCRRRQGLQRELFPYAVGSNGGSCGRNGGSFVVLRAGGGGRVGGDSSRRRGDRPDDYDRRERKKRKGRGGGGGGGRSGGRGTGGAGKEKGAIEAGEGEQWGGEARLSGLEKKVEAEFSRKVDSSELTRKARCVS